ncbi:uncharacterized protein LOC141907776 [Tubulanus polymorphus]|uniref:uncharacterized protein LOC141907776 n=1 Tax=Tubulanus polymorphus TaxID=672921 RepID=UPI003DA20C27
MENTYRLAPLLEIRQGKRPTDPIAVRTHLGWCILGHTVQGSRNEPRFCFKTTAIETHGTVLSLDKQVEKFWETETFGGVDLFDDDKKSCSVEDHRGLEIFDKSCCSVDEHYQRFRLGVVAIAADVEGMFHQVKVPGADSKSLLFLWQEDLTADGEPEVYKMTAIELAKEVTEILARGGFHLTKWMSNNREVPAQISKDERARPELDLELDEMPVERALGVKWDVETDSFLFKPAVRVGIPTKRLVVSTGEVSYTADMETELRLGYCIVCTKVEFHIFCDASEAGFAAVVYLRMERPSDEFVCSFLALKTKVAPLEMLTVPKLELEGAVLVVMLSSSLKHELKILEFERTCYWTDAVSVLRYINNMSTRLKTFVANRLAKIHRSTNAQQRMHVPSDQNAADAATKGLPAAGIDWTPYVYRFSPWFKLRRHVAWLLRAVRKFSSVIPRLKVDRGRKGRLLFLNISKRSPLLPLRPFYDGGVLRVGGRLTNAVIPYEAKHQVISPFGDHITRLIVADVHESLYHAGPEHAISERVAGYTRPFTYTGIDYFGPMFVKLGRSIVKRWCRLFTCLLTRAIHLEVADNLETNAFILVLRNFIGRRGPPSEIYSDNGTNFVGADRELSEALELLNQAQVHNHLLKRGIFLLCQPLISAELGNG